MYVHSRGFRSASRRSGAGSFSFSRPFWSRQATLVNVHDRREFNSRQLHHGAELGFRGRGREPGRRLARPKAYICICQTDAKRNRHPLRSDHGSFVRARARGSLGYITPAARVVAVVGPLTTLKKNGWLGDVPSALPGGLRAEVVIGRGALLRRTRLSPQPRASSATDRIAGYHRTAIRRVCDCVVG